MSDDLKPNLLLDEMWEAAGKSVEKFAERTNKAAADFRPNTWLDRAFGVFKDLAGKTRLSIASLALSVKDTVARFTQLKKEVTASAAASRKAGSRTANRQTNDAGQVANNEAQAANGAKPGYTAVLQKAAAAVRSALETVVEAFRQRRGSFQANLQKPTSVPSQSSSSTSNGTWSTAIQGIVERLKTFRERLGIGIDEVVAEFGNMIGQLRDFGRDVAAATRAAIRALMGMGAQIWNAISPAITQPMLALGSALRNLPSVVAKPIVDLAAAIRKGIDSVSSSVSHSSFGKIMRDVGQSIYQPLAAVGDLASSAAGIMARGFGEMFAWIASSARGMFTGQKKKKRKSKKKGEDEEGGMISLASKGIGNVMSAFNAMMAGLNSIGDFVKSVNPGLMVQLQMVMSDLSAVIGTALAPIIQAVIPLFRSLADTLYPLAKQFAEILKPLLEVVSQLAGSIIKLVGSILTALMPIIVIMSDGLAVMAGALSVIVSTIKILFDGLVGFIGSFFSGAKPGEFKETIEFIISSFRKLSNHVILAAASIAKFFGATSFVTGMINSFKPKGEDATGLAAAQNPAYKSIESLGKDFALQAAIATGGAEGKKSQDEIGMEMVAKLDEIEKNGTTLAQVLRDLPGNIAVAIKDNANKVVTETANSVTNYAADAYDAFVTLPKNLVTISANMFNW